MCALSVLSILTGGQSDAVSLLKPVFRWCLRRQSREVFAEERGVCEVHLVRNSADGLVGMAQLHLDAGDECAVNPLFGRDAAGLADDSAEIAFGEAQFRGIEADMVLTSGVKVDQIDETVEDALLVGARCSQCVRLAVV